MLEHYKREVTGILQVAQSRFFLQRIESALEASDHERAAAAVLATARQSTEYNLSPRAWRELISIGLTQAVLAGSRGLLAEIIEQYGWLAWSGETDEAQPWELGASLAQDQVDPKAGAYLGDLLGRAYPNCALGPYTAAHFREREQLAKSAAIEPAWAAANASRFERAALLADRVNKHDLANHCRLRQGVTLMLGKIEAQTARGLLKKLDRDALSPRELLWYAIGMMLSDFWLDRVRAADTIDAIATDVIEARPGPVLRAIDKGTIERLVDYLLARQGLELQAAEEDRVRALIGLVYKDSWRARQKNASLELLLDLQQRVRTPLTECGELIEHLEDRAPTMGEDWTQSARMMRALHLQLSPTQTSPPLPRQPPSERHTYSLRALEVLAAIEQDDPGAIEQALLQTRKSLGEQAVGKDPDAATPIAVALPTLLSWIKNNAPKKRRAGDPEPSDEERLRAERHDFIRELTQACVRAWAPQALSPSYGWWELAAHLIDAKLAAGADAVGIRALSSHQSPDPSLRDFVLGGLLSWSIEAADRPAMLRWLEAVEALQPEQQEDEA